MTFREWLPQTRRNRIALTVASLSLVSFVVWNFLPYHSSKNSPREGVVASGIWAEMFDYENYLLALRNPDVDDIFSLIASFMVILTGLLVVLTLPLWRFFESSALMRLPPAIMTLLGGIAVSKFAVESVGDGYSHFVTVITLTLIALNMLLSSAALFLMEKEIPPHPLATTNRDQA
jgi:hypothetical protein